MNRREFLTGLMGASAALVLVPKLGLLADVVEGPSVDWYPTLSALHDEAWRLFQKHYGASVVSTGSPLYVGSVRNGLLMNRQFNVGTLNDGWFGLQIGPAMSPGTYGGMKLDGAMHALANACKEAQIQAFAPLHLPKALEYGENRGDVLRMVHTYDVVYDATITRFDVLGAGA